MGSSQSKLDESQIRQQLLERLQALDDKYQHNDEQTKQSSLDRDYVIVGDERAQDGRDKDARPSHEVSIELAKKWERDLLDDPKNRLALSAFTSNSVQSIIHSRTVKPASAETFNIAIPIEGSPVTNQRASGRCWLFAATNVFRIALMKMYNIEKLELSQAYLFYWDKLEKANYLLENIIETAEGGEPLDGRLVNQLLKSPVGDGGQWDMVANLVQKYGLIPQSVYPDSFNAMNSGAMDSLLTTKLRQDSLRLRKIVADCTMSPRGKKTKLLMAEKNRMLQEAHLILTLMLGTPPVPSKDFTWEYYDKSGKYHKLVTSPLEFSKQLSSSQSLRACSGVDVHKLFSLVNDPRNDYETLLTVDGLGNVWNGRPVTYVNVQMSTMKEACVKMLSAGFPVFFGCDVGKFMDRENGVLDTNLYDYELGFNVKLSMNKAQRLQTNESAMTHAMVFTAVHVENGQSKRWRVENSWSEQSGDHGYFVMTDEWYDAFVYQAVVAPHFVSESVKDVLDKSPKSLPIWDPLGALA